MQSQYPPRAPTPQNTSNFIPYFLGFCVLLTGSCGAGLAYLVYRSETPEGKKEAKELDEKNAKTLDDFAQKMRRVRDGLPPVDAEAEKCANPVDGALAPVVDTFFFASLEEGRDDAGRFARQDGDILVRDSLFSDSILDAELERAGIDAGPSLFSTPFATANIESLSRKPIVLVLDVDELTPPSADSSGWSQGELSGAVDVVDWSSDKTICHVPITAKSSDTVSFGGGVQLKFHGIPSPTIGKTDLDEAVDKDFEANLKAAVKSSLASIGVKS